MTRDKGLLARFVLILGGEFVQSAFHFALNIALVRTLTQYDYGVFSIVFLVGGIGLTYVRALAGVPAITFVPPRLGRAGAKAIEVTFGSGALLVSVLIGAGVCVALLFTPQVHPLPGGLFVALWCLRSYLRLAFFAKRRPLESGLGDLTFALLGTGLALLLVHGDDARRIEGVFVALACAHAAGILVSLAALRERVRVSFGAPFRRRYGALRGKLGWSLLGVTTTTLQGQGQVLVAALIAGPDAYAPIAACLVLFAPLRLGASALGNMVQPEIAAHLASGDLTGARRLARRATLLLVAGCLAYGGLLLLGMPVIDAHLFAGRYAHEPLALITGLLWAVVTVSLAYGAPRLLLETAQDFRFLAGLSAASAAAGMAAVTLLLVVSTPAWSILGLLLSETIVLVACSAVFAPAGSARSVRTERRLAGSTGNA